MADYVPFPDDDLMTPTDEKATSVTQQTPDDLFVNSAEYQALESAFGAAPDSDSEEQDEDSTRRALLGKLAKAWLSFNTLFLALLRAAHIAFDDEAGDSAPIPLNAAPQVFSAELPQEHRAVRTVLISTGRELASTRHAADGLKAGIETHVSLREIIRSAYTDSSISTATLRSYLEMYVAMEGAIQALKHDAEAHSSRAAEALRILREKAGLKISAAICAVSTVGYATSVVIALPVMLSTVFASTAVAAGAYVVLAGGTSFAKAATTDVNQIKTDLRQALENIREVNSLYGKIRSSILHYKKVLKQRVKTLGTVKSVLSLVLVLSGSTLLWRAMRRMAKRRSKRSILFMACANSLKSAKLKDGRLQAENLPSPQRLEAALLEDPLFEETAERLIGVTLILAGLKSLTGFGMISRGVSFAINFCQRFFLRDKYAKREPVIEQNRGLLLALLIVILVCYQDILSMGKGTFHFFKAMLTTKPKKSVSFAPMREETQKSGRNHVKARLNQGRATSHAAKTASRRRKFLGKMMQFYDEDFVLYYAPDPDADGYIEDDPHNAYDEGNMYTLRQLYDMDDDRLYRMGGYFTFGEQAEHSEDYDFRLECADTTPYHFRFEDDYGVICAPSVVSHMCTTTSWIVDTDRGPAQLTDVVSRTREEVPLDPLFRPEAATAKRTRRGKRAGKKKKASAQKQASVKPSPAKLRQEKAAAPTKPPVVAVPPVTLDEHEEKTFRPESRIRFKSKAQAASMVSVRACDNQENFYNTKQLVGGHITKVGQQVRLILTGHVTDIMKDQEGNLDHAAYGPFLDAHMFANYNTKIMVKMSDCTVVSHDKYFLILAVPLGAYPYKVADGYQIAYGADPAPASTGMLLYFDQSAKQPTAMSVRFAPSTIANGGVEQIVYTFDANESTVPGDCGALVVQGSKVIGCHIGSTAVQGGGRKGFAHPYSFARNVLSSQ